MKKQELIERYLTSKDKQDLINRKRYVPIPTREIGILPELRYGIEIEFPYNKRDERELMYNFEYYNRQELGNKWELNQEVNFRYPPDICIGEFVSPILKDDLNSLDNLNVITQLIKAYENKRLKANSRNIHFHFDGRLLGENLEYLHSFLEVFRAYENITHRISTLETGRVIKSGISNRIGEALKATKPKDVLKIYNGGEYNLQNLIEYRKLSINLFNIGAYIEAKDTIPGVVERQGVNKMLLDKESIKFTLDVDSYDTTQYIISKRLTPTFELRLNPSTHNLGYIQQHLLLDSTLIFMARNIKRIIGLEDKVKARNRLIDEKGPQVFDLDFDDGIADIITFLPPDLARRLLLAYINSRQLNLYKDQVVR